MLCMEYSLIWTICHKLMWFYRNTALFHIIFAVTHGEIFGHLGHLGPLTVKTKWRCRRCIGGDCVVFLLLLKEIRLQLSHKASQQVLLQHVSHTAETDNMVPTGSDESKLRTFQGPFQDQISHYKDFYSEFHNADIHVPNTLHICGNFLLF